MTKYRARSRKFVYICFAHMGNDKITIIDVARKAGVSKGTVDRVLHDRGEVSAKSIARVRKAIEELDYEPNLHASLLATRKARVIACLLPVFEEGEYWQKLHDGFVEGGRQVAHLNVRTEVFSYDQYDIRSFRRAADELLASEPSGVVLPPLFKGETMLLADRLATRGIPYVYVDTKLEEGGYLAYFGMPMYKSGYLCAALLTERVRPEDFRDVLIVRLNRDKTGQSDPTANRREGFLDYISANFPDCEVHSLFVNPSDCADVDRRLREFFESHPDVRNIVMFNSRVHLIAPFLASRPDPLRRVIGFDNLNGNIEMLKSGLADIIISQHTENQSAGAVRLLSDFILMHKSPAIRDNYMHMDILTRLNIENY